MARIFPPTRIPGCLPRRTKLGERFPIFSDHIEVLPQDELDRLAGTISLRPFVKTILDQDGVGSCATESTTQAVMIARAVAGQEHVVLNPWFIYHTTSGGRDQGSAIDDNLAFVMENVLS